MCLPPQTPSEGDRAIALLSRQLLPVLSCGSHPSLQPSGPSSQILRSTGVADCSLEVQMQEDKWRKSIPMYRLAPCLSRAVIGRRQCFEVVCGKLCGRVEVIRLISFHLFMSKSCMTSFKVLFHGQLELDGEHRQTV